MGLSLNELELEELIVEANSNNNIDFLNEIFLEKNCRYKENN